jgi:hypothetical protein
MNVHALQRVLNTDIFRHHHRLSIDQLFHGGSRTKAVHAVSHELAVHVEGSGVLWVESFHHDKRHVLGWLPMPFPLVDEPVVDLLLI